MALLARFQKKLLEAGCDEAGRGCLAGPVTAAAVILKPRWNHELLNDSKQLTEEERNILRKEIELNAEDWAVAHVDHKGIDKINILNASFKAMHKALAKLNQEPEMLLIDGNRFHPWRDKEFACIIKGDGKYRSIAAASILAKTHRDAYMQKLHKKHPLYHWDSNKGYPTQAHRDAIIEHGPSPYHRQSFRLYPLPEQLELF